MFFPTLLKFDHPTIYHPTLLKFDDPARIEAQQAASKHEKRAFAFHAMTLELPLKNFITLPCFFCFCVGAGLLEELDDDDEAVQG
jgi:hypothetical protein